MFTHEVDVQDADHFSKFLGVPLLTREPLLAGSDRVRYFQACEGAEHLFLDPDTGLKLCPANSGKGSQHYLFGEELVRLAERRRKFLTLTFDQSLSRGRDAEPQVKDKLARLSIQGLCGFAYVSHACFIAVGRDASLVWSARDMILSKSGLPSHRLVSATPDTRVRRTGERCAAM
jgi:hypothetical protein